VHQKCFNYTLTNLLFGFCKFVWIIDPLVTHPSPHPKAPTRPSTLKILRIRECTLTLSPSVVFTFGFVVKSIKEFRSVPQLLHAYIPNNIGLNNMNYYSWTRKIHMVKTMIIIVSTKRTINKSLNKPKNFLPFEVRNAIEEGRSKCVICHNSC